MCVLRRVLLLIGMLVLGGCVPFPNMHYYAPTIGGIVMKDGKPAAGAEIRVSASFSNEVRTAVADSEGHFSTQPIRELQLTAILIGDPLYGYAVEIRSAGSVFSGFADFGAGYAPSTIRLICDLSHPVRGLDHQVYCTMSADPASS